MDSIIKLFLVGNANTGKTTLFNSLTKSNNKTGNWHGVTNSESEADFKIKDKSFLLVDLPGIYSLTPLSFEEEVSTNYILKNTDKLCLNICEQENITRNLYLTMQLLELGLQTILIVNTKNKNCILDLEVLSDKLGIKVLEYKNEKSIQKIKEEIYNFCPTKIKNPDYIKSFLNNHNFVLTKKQNIILNDTQTKNKTNNLTLKNTDLEYKKGKENKQKNNIRQRSFFKKIHYLFLKKNTNKNCYKIEEIKCKKKSKLNIKIKKEIIAIKNKIKMCFKKLIVKGNKNNPKQNEEILEDKVVSNFKDDLKMCEKCKKNCKIASKTLNNQDFINFNLINQDYLKIKILEGDELVCLYFEQQKVCLEEIAQERYKHIDFVLKEQNLGNKIVKYYDDYFYKNNKKNIDVFNKNKLNNKNENKRFPNKKIEDEVENNLRSINNQNKDCENKCEKKEKKQNRKNDNFNIYGRSKFDKILLNKFLSIPIFFAILVLIFYLTFFSAGSFVSDWLQNAINSFGKTLISFLNEFFGYGWFVDLIDQALIGGIGSVLSFLPQVCLLFLFLSILEDSGYLSRVAFLFEDLFCKIGLSGKGVYTLLMGFGCSATSILTARNMEDKNAKTKIALITPYFSCSAKLPIYAVLGGAFFGANNIFVIVGLYLCGVVIGLSLCAILNKTVYKSKEQSFILEFAPLKFVSLKRILKLVWDNVKQFLIRIGTLLICINVIIWIVSSFSFGFKYVPFYGGASMLESLGKIISVIFVPLGFGTWGATSALLAGLVAKEIVISSIAIFNGVSSNSSRLAQSLYNPTSAVSFTPCSAISFLIFCLLYTPCVTTLAVIKKEFGTKFSLLALFSQFAVAYLVSFFAFSFLTFNTTNLIGIFVAVTVLLGLIMLVKNSKKKKLKMKCKVT